MQFTQKLSCKKQRQVRDCKLVLRDCRDKTEDLAQKTNFNKEECCEMKKVIVFGLVVACTAGGAFAQNDVVMVNSGGSQTKVTAEAAMVSSYVWRGQVYNNDFVVQPQITLETYGVSFNIWANYNAAGADINGTSSDFSEIDLTLAYTLPFNLDDVTFDVGVVNYNFPANGNAVTPSTTELFGVATLLTFKNYIIPSFTLYGDVDKADGVYMLFDVVAPYQVSDYFSIEGGISAGYGNTSYNDYYFNNAVGGASSSQDAGWNDYNFYANASYEILDNLTIAANLTYTMLEGGSIRSAAGNIYDAKEKVWGGVNLIYDF